MVKYHNIIGIDTGKSSFVVNLHGCNEVHEFENNNSGIRKFVKQYKDILSTTLSIIEGTGGYEAKILNHFSMKKYPIHRADARKVKYFIRSFGNKAKTDALDAKALSLYGKERSDGLVVYTPPSAQEKLLFQLAHRRSDLKQMLVSEKNRLSAPDNAHVRCSCNKIIKALQSEVTKVTDEMRSIIYSDNHLMSKVQVMMTVPGVGELTAFDLLVLLPELGSLDRRQIASLAGVAPRSNDSGIKRGYRSVSPGRQGVKPVLFLSAMAARNSKSSLKEFYERLIENGKKKMVALTALMRKILIIANARVRELENNLQHG